MRDGLSRGLLETLLVLVGLLLIVLDATGAVNGFAGGSLLLSLGGLGAIQRVNAPKLEKGLVEDLETLDATIKECQ